MYFEDIYELARPCWDYPIKAREIGLHYQLNVEDYHNQLEPSVKYWVELMNWSIGVVMSNHSISLGLTDTDFISLKDLPIRKIEERFREDLHEESWEKELKLYKGFRNPPK